MLPYLENPRQRSLRKTNFTQTAGNLEPAGQGVPPCVVPGVNTGVLRFALHQPCASGCGDSARGRPYAASASTT